MARIAIVGVGAIGGAAAGLLEMAGGHEIMLCTRRSRRSSPKLPAELPRALTRCLDRPLGRPRHSQLRPDPIAISHVQRLHFFQASEEQPRRPRATTLMLLELVNEQALPGQMPFHFHHVALRLSQIFLQ